MAKKKRKRSAKQRANDKRLSQGKKPIKQKSKKRKTTTRKRSTRKGQVRKTARRAYKGLKKRTRRSKCIMKGVTKRYKKKSDNWSF